MVLVVGSTGMRAGILHVTPSLDLLSTRSLAVQFTRKRQSDQTTYTVPAASISAEGNGVLRNPPCSAWSVILEIDTVLLQVVPPSLELNASMLFETPRIGTITLPLRCTSGCPPRPAAELAVARAAPQVSPPSVEVDI